MSPLLLVGILVITSAYADVKHVLEGSAHPPDPNSISPQAVNRLSTPYWWMDANSPLKAAYDYYKKCTAKNNCVSPVDPAAPAPQPFIPSSSVSAAPEPAALAPISIKGNPFLNGDFNPQAGNANYNDKEVKIDIKKNPFLSGAVVTAGNGSPVVKDQNGFLGVQPSQPFGKKPGFGTTHPLDKSKKPGFATTHPLKGQNYVNVTVACKGAGFACVEKRLCLNGVVNTNGEGLLQVRSDVRYCHEDTEVCCQMNNLNEITSGKTSTIKFAGGSGFSPGLIHVQPQEPLKPEIIFGGENGHHSSSTSKSIRDTSLSPNSVFSSTVDYSDVQFANDVRFGSTFQGPAYLPPIGPTTPAPRPFETKRPSINQQYVPSRPSTAQYRPPSPTTQRPAPSTPKYIPPSPTTPRPVPTFRPVTTSTYRPAPSTTAYRPAPPVTFRPAPSTTFRPAPPVTFRPAPSTTFRPAPPVTFKPAPTTSREYLPPRPSTPRPSNTNNQYVPPYQPSVTPQKPYQPSVTPQKPYQPSFTTQQPYRPSVTTQRPYQPSVTPQRPYQPSVTPQKPYQPSVTPQKPYQPSVTPQQPYRPAITTQRPYQPSITPQQPYQPSVTPQRPYQPSITPQQPYQPSVTPQRPYQPSITPQRPYQPSTSRPTTSREYLPPRTTAPFVPQPSSPRPNPFVTQPTTPRPTYQQQTRPTPSYKYPSPSGPSTFPQPRPTPGPSYPEPRPTPGPSFTQPRPTFTQPRPTPGPSYPQPRPTPGPSFTQPRPTPGPSYPQPRPTPGPSFTQPRPTFTQPRPTPGPSYPQPRPTPGPSFTQPRPTPGPSYPQPRPTPGPSFTQPRPAYSPATFPQPRPTQRPQPSGPTQGYQYPTPRPQTRPTPPPFRPTPSIPQFTPAQPRPTSPPVNTGYQYPTPNPPFPSPSPQPRPTPRPQFPSPAQPRPSIPQFPSPSPQPRPTPRPQFPSPSPPQPRPSIPQFPSPSSPQPRPTPPPVTPGYQYPSPQPSFPSLRPSIPQFPSPSPPQPRPIPQFPSPQPRPTPRPQFPSPSPPQPRPIPQFPSPQPRPTPRPQFPSPSPPQPRPIPQFPSPQPRPTPRPQFPSPSTPQPRPTPPPVNTGYQYPTPQQPFPSPSPQPRPTPRPQFPSPTPPQPRPSENTPGYQFPTPSSPRPNPFIPQQSTPSRPVTSPPFSPSTNYIQPSTPSRPAPSLRPYEPSTPKPFVPQPTPAPNPAGGYEYPKPTPTFGYPSTSRPVFGNSNVNNQYIPPPKKPSENPDQSFEAANVDGAFIRPTTARTQFQGELNTAPPPGCAAALKCVQEIYCSAEGVISPVPVVLTKEQELSRVPTTVCQDTESGIIGKCCRDPNYKDPWPSANLVDGVDDGQYKEDNNFGQYQQDLQRPVRSDKGGPRQDLSNNRNTNFQVPQPTCGERHLNTKPPGPGPLDVNFAEIPWQAMVLRDSNRSLLCGGAIIRKDAVLTAAHCVEGLETSDILVKGGEWKLGIDEEPLPFQIVKVAVVVRHPQYQKGSFVNDLAVLILEEKLRPAKNIGTLCLPAPNQIPTQNCIATGWGKRILQLHAKGAIMHAIDVKIMDNQQCQDTLAGTFQHALSNYSPNTLCGYSDINQCKVDYGSALACSDGNRFTLSGIYAWDTGCKQPGQIGGYIAPDVDWIESTLAKPVRELKQLERN